MNKLAYTKLMGLHKRAEEEVGDLGPLQHKKRLSQSGIDAAKSGAAVALASLLGAAKRGLPGAVGGGITGLLGVLGAKLGGNLVGRIDGPRTLSNYKQYLKDRSWSDWLVPGKIEYNSAREKATLDALQRNKALELISGLKGGKNN